MFWSTHHWDAFLWTLSRLSMSLLKFGAQKKHDSPGRRRDEHPGTGEGHLFSGPPSWLGPSIARWGGGLKCGCLVSCPHYFTLIPLGGSSGGWRCLSLAMDGGLSYLARFKQEQLLFSKLLQSWVLCWHLSHIISWNPPATP